MLIRRLRRISQPYVGYLYPTKAAAIPKAVGFDNLIFSNQNRMRALRYTRYLNSTR